MCMPGLASPGYISQGGQTFYSPGGVLGASLAKDPTAVKSAREQGRLESLFGTDPYMAQMVARTENRMYDPADPYGLRAEKEAARDRAFDEKVSAFEQRQQNYEQNRARLGTITTSQGATVKPASTATRTPQRVRPIRSSLRTTSGVKQIPTASSLSSGMGLNVPN